MRMLPHSGTISPLHCNTECVNKLAVLPAGKSAEVNVLVDYTAQSVFESAPQKSAAHANATEGVQSDNSTPAMGPLVFMEWAHAMGMAPANDEQ